MYSSQSTLLVIYQIGLFLLAANSVHVHRYNSIAQCKSTDFFDLEHFKCRPCNATIGLTPSDSRK